MDEKTQHTIRIRKIDKMRQIVFGVVYEPNVLDTHGDMMLPEDIELMAHRFMADVKLRTSIDTMHDNIPNGSYPIESFIARDNDPDYPPGSWVLGLKVVDAKVWGAVMSGDLNGYSFEAYCTKKPVIVEIEYDAVDFGVTEENSGHDHFFWVKFDDSGVIVGGRTSAHADGHWHQIKSGTATEKADGHAHRIALA